MSKTLTIKIKPVGEAMADFRETSARSRPVAASRAGRESTSRASRRPVTSSAPSRLAVLRAVRTKRPRSIYELAKTLKRDFKNVQEDLRILERYGLVRVAKSRGSRRARVPEALFGEIALRIAI